MLYLQGEILQHAISGTGIAGIGIEMWIKDDGAHLGTSTVVCLGGILGEKLGSWD